jgi:hypothetical protein
MPYTNYEMIRPGGVPKYAEEVQAQEDKKKAEDIQLNEYIQGQNKSRLEQLDQRQFAGAQNVQAGQSTINQQMANQFRAGQEQLVNRLQQVSNGQTAGAGELAAQRQASRAIAAQQAMARMGRGNPMAGLGAMRGVADIGAQSTGQSQQAAMQDQQNAQSMLGQVLGQGRGQDMSLAQAQAEMDQQRMLQNAQMSNATNVANMQGQLGFYGQQDSSAQGYLGGLAGNYAAQQAAAQAEKERRDRMIAGVLTAAGTIGGFAIGGPAGAAAGGAVGGAAGKAATS